jgi:hypothetical protein
MRMLRSEAARGKNMARAQKRKGAPSREGAEQERTSRQAQGERSQKGASSQAIDAREEEGWTQPESSAQKQPKDDRE